MATDETRSHPEPPAIHQPDHVPIARFLTSGTTVLVVIIIITALALAMGALSLDRQQFDGDEEIYMRVIKMFGQGLSLDLLRTYGGEPASPAPLFFMTYAVVGKVFGFTYPVFRAFSYVLTLLTVWVVWRSIQKPRLDGQRDFFALLLILFPYIFCMGFSVMAEPLTLLLAVVGMCCYMGGLTRKSNLYLLFGSIAITGALYVRIHAMFAPAALVVVLLLRRDWSPIPWLLAVAPFAARAPLVLLQGGLTVSREAFEQTKPELGFTPSNINFFFVWFGYTFFPLLWWCRGRLKINLPAAIALLPLFFLFMPDFLGSEHKGALRTFFLRAHLTTSAAQWLALPIWFVGSYITVDLVQRVVTGGKELLREMYFGSCVILFMLSLSFSSVAFERYYQLAVPAVVLMGVARTRRTGGYYAFLVAHVFFFALTYARLSSDM